MATVLQDAQMERLSVERTFTIRQASRDFPIAEQRGKFWITGGPLAYLWPNGQIHPSTGSHGEGWYETREQAEAAITFYGLLQDAVSNASGCDSAGRGNLSQAPDGVEIDDQSQTTRHTLHDTEGRPLAVGVYELSRPGERSKVVEIFEDQLCFDLWFRVKVAGRIKPVPQRVDELAGDVHLRRI